ncbi:MAG: hypothetical protein M3463_00210 [Verrucomicrobiota bacterium]|nr:hypothetical protein [Verrucomicrobiota bacterium]
MKTLRFVLIALCFCSSVHLQASDAWKEQPILQAIRLSVFTAMGEYELWAEEWKKVKRSPTSSDRSMNVMVETTFIVIQMALEAHPNPPLLEQCLKFLGTTVPPEFDDMWRARILEGAYLDKATSKKVNEMLKSKNLPSLEERASGPK